MTARQRHRPEALAQFAETAREETRKDRPGLVADEATKPIPTDSTAKDEAATKVLQEGATGADHGAEEAIDRLPDRILESRHAGAADIGQAEEPEQGVSDREPYDATTDPRTGRPPLPIEAQELNRERELQQLRNAQLSEGEEDIAADEGDIATDEADIDVMLEEDVVPSHDLDDDEIEKN
jgi:hypothetical protein